MILALGLSACGGSGETVGEALGYEQRGPDEMTVIKRPPLTLPPDYNLRPPRPDEPRAEADAASETARETLIGPASGLTSGSAGPGLAPVNGAAASDPGSAAERAEATLTGGADQALEQPSPPPPPSAGEAAAENPSSAGQSALLSRTNRVERDLDALDRTRHESRVDGAFLRRLLAWAPAADTAETAAADDGAAPAPGDVVRIVKREQRPVETGIRSE